MTHELKTLPRYFKDAKAGLKNFEIRKDDRPYHVGDKLHLREYMPVIGYTGEELRTEITYVLRDCPEYGLMPGYCIIGHNGGDEMKNIEFIASLDAETIKAELLVFLEDSNIDLDIVDQFADFIKEDLSRA